MNELIDYFTPTRDSASSVCAMARQAFSETFARLYDPVPFSRFLEQAYGLGGSMERDLADPFKFWQVAAVNGQPIGYAKLSPLRAPAPNPQPEAMELQQIYVLSHWHGRGVGEKLINRALGKARTENASEIYLTVFDHNTLAKRFYRRHGFSEVGLCTFQLGDRVDDDRVWRKNL